MPLFLAKKEVFEWLAHGQKTIDIRKGNPKPGEIAVFQSGPQYVAVEDCEDGIVGGFRRFCVWTILKLLFLRLCELGDAVDYLQRIYGVCDGVFTAYYVEPLVVFRKSVD